MIKKIVAVAMAVSMAVGIVGCEDLPSPEKMKTISTVIGNTAGYACELSKTKASVKEAINAVFNVVGKVVPKGDETFTKTWGPLIDEELQKLVEKGKLDEGDAKVARIALTAATEGIDYVFVKYPKAKDVKELVDAAVEGFIAGYKSVVSFSANEKVEIDDGAYKYLKEKLSSTK